MQAPRPPGGPLIFNHSYNADYFSDIGTAYGHAMNADHPILRAILSADGGYAEASRT